MQNTACLTIIFDENLSRKIKQREFQQVLWGDTNNYGDRYTLVEVLNLLDFGRNLGLCVFHHIKPSFMINIIIFLKQ